MIGRRITTNKHDEDVRLYDRMIKKIKTSGEKGECITQRASMMTAS